MEKFSSWSQDRLITCTGPGAGIGCTCELFKVFTGYLSCTLQVRILNNPE